MTVADVETWLAKIRQESHDDEAAHGFEDEMREMVLSEIARGATNAAELAAAALKSRDIDFARWCA